MGQTPSTAPTTPTRRIRSRARASIERYRTRRARTIGGYDRGRDSRRVGRSTRDDATTRSIDSSSVEVLIDSRAKRVEASSARA